MEKLGSGKEKSRIRDKHPGSATLINIEWKQGEEKSLTASVPDP
jgi:hypothetical protein